MTRILLVEDSVTQAQELAFMLEDAGFRVEIAQDAMRAFALLAEGVFDLVLTDLFLPGDSGIDLCRRIKADPRHRHLPVLLLTRSANPVHLLRGLEAGADDFMTKDNEPAEITDRILRALSPRRSSTDGPEPSVRPIAFRGERFQIGTERERLLNVLLSAFEDLLRVSESNRQELARRLQAEEGLRQAHAELEQKIRERTAELAAVNRDLAEKNRENEMFVYSVSHDLRSPLVNLQGFAKELSIVSDDLRGLLSEASVPPPVRDRGLAMVAGDMAEAIRFIQAAVTRLSSIIDALLQLSRAGRAEFPAQRVDVNALVQRVVASAQGTIRERGAVVTVRALAPAWGNPTGLERVFANLIGNALSYLDPKRPGLIEVGMHELTGDARANDRLMYYVRDNGLGIPEAYYGKIFQAFQRVHPEVAKGEGIGLAIVARIIERHRGRVWVESKPGAGSTFFISLSTAAPGAES